MKNLRLTCRLFGLASLITLCSLPAPAQQSAAEKKTVWLDTLQIEQMSSGWGKARRNKSVQDKPLSIGGKTFQRGVGTHAVSSFVVDLKGGTDRFRALVGVDDEVAKSRGSIEFVVRADQKEVWKSGLMHSGDAAKPLDVPLKGVHRLELLVRDGGDNVSYDHADWAEARFDVSGAAPVALTALRRDRFILTPAGAPTPRINGATVFGVRPGSPVLFTIAATGERPMRFAVENLPAGLQVDPNTGFITGSLNERGTYAVTFVAANSRGEAKRPFKFVCGDTLALTPHMGWNSWYIWENHVTDQIMRDAADAMVRSGMRDHGYQYVNIDDCWSVKPGAKDPSLGGEPRDASGKVNSNRRFPDMKALTDYIHARGLKAGTYTGPGPTTCAGHVAAYQHEEADVQRYVEWGFDFLKHDWCSYGQIAKGNSLPELQKPYRLISELLKKQPRDVILNLCQYGMGNVWTWGKEVGGHSWRTAGDLGGSFEGIGAALFRDGFDLYSQRELHKYGGPGGWNDPDYILLGYLSNWRGGTAPSPLTTDEQYAQITLWCIVAAPLIFSGDMMRLDEFTLGLLCNDELIDVDQDPLGKPGRRVAKAGDAEVWLKEMEDGSKAVGLFNRDPFDFQKVTVRWADLGIEGSHRVRDLWRQKELGNVAGQFEMQVAPHGAEAIRVF